MVPQFPCVIVPTLAGVGTYNVNTSFNKQMNSDFLLGTNHKIGDFTIDGSFGGNMWTVNNKNTSQGVTDFVVRDIYSIGNGITKTQNYGISRSAGKLFICICRFWL